MKQRTHKILYDVHSWLGVGIGLILYVICFTGTLTVFRDEIRVWSNPMLWAIKSNGDAVPSLDRAVGVFDRHYDLSSAAQWAIRLPGRVNPAYELLIPAKERPGLVRAYAHPSRDLFMGESNNQIADFIFSLHANLSLRSRWGRYLVGFTGVALLLLIVTGVFIHRHIFRDLFTMRWTHSTRLVTADAHKATATWALLFHLMMAFSGAFLGLKNLLIFPPALAEHGGDLSAAQKQLSPSRVKPSGEAAPMAGADALLNRARAEVPGFIPTLAVFQNWGDANARLTISGSLPGRLLPKNEAVRVTFDAVGGERLETENGLLHSGWRRIYDAMMPLHYGDYGGIGLQVFYFLFGIATTTLTWTGIVIWIERRKGLTAARVRIRERRDV